jgi:hypothetical protein
MAEELRTSGVPFPNSPAITHPTIDQPEVKFWTAKEPEARLFLDQLIRGHKDDCAYQVCTPCSSVVPVSHARNRTLSHL